LSKDRFEDHFKKLETVVNRLESGDLPLEESVKLFEEGMRLTRICSEKLTEIRKKVEILLKDEKGETVVQPFPLEEEDASRE
jgi:exodeoxyribonuclease VII small subunit